MTGSYVMAGGIKKVIITGGKTLTISTNDQDSCHFIEGQEVASFERMGAPDKENIYGKYTNDEMGFVEGGEIYFEFVEEGVSYMVISQSSEYTYDEEAGTVTVVDADGEEEVSSVKFDGNNMTVEDQEGKIETFTRAD